MENKTRNHIIKEYRNRLIVKAYSSGDFLMEEIAEMFNRGVGTIFRIVNKKGRLKKIIIKK